MTNFNFFHLPQRPLSYAAVTALALAVVGAGHAMGQANDLDADGDGLISYSELLVLMPDLTDAEFAALDGNADGGLDAAEMEAAQQAGLVPSD
jgi:hypothetical protein